MIEFTITNRKGVEYKCLILRNTDTGKRRLFRNVSITDYFTIQYALANGRVDDLELSNEDVTDG